MSSSTIIYSSKVIFVQVKSSRKSQQLATRVGLESESPTRVKNTDSKEFYRCFLVMPMLCPSQKFEESKVNPELTYKCT